MEDKKEETFRLFGKEKPKKPGKLSIKINKLEQEIAVIKEQLRIVKSRLGL